MAPLLLRRSIRNRKIDDDDENENGNGKNGERNGTAKHNKGNSKNKNKKNVSPLAAAATETKKKTSFPSHLQAKKKKKLKVTTPQPAAAAAELQPLLAVLHHPYMELHYPKRLPTIQQIQRMEESVLLKLIDRSKWRSYPSGPQQCYEKSLTNTNTNTNPTGDGDGDGDFVVDGSSRSRSISSRRITHLKIIDNTFYERLQLILAFRNAAAANRNRNNANNRNHDHHDHLEQLQLPPRILGPRPMWRMTKDIAILDQLQIMELYRCTGRLPKSMNYLNCLVRLQLDGCRNIDLSLLGLGLGNSTTAINTNKNNNRLHNLMELKITDCEDLTPIKFRNLSNLKRISLMRWDKSNNNTINLGHRWIDELSLASVVVSAPATTTTTEVSLVASSSSMNDNNNNNNNVIVPSNEQQQQQQPVVPLQVLEYEFQFRLSLQCLTFSGSRLTNKDLSTILFRMLVGNRFPSLHTLIINDNPEINSFMDVLQLSPPPPPPHNYVPVVPTMATNLKTIKLSGTRIQVNNEELDSVIYFLEKLYPTVGIMKVFCYGSCTGKDGVVSFRENSPSITHIHNKRMILLPSDQRKKINKIEYLLSMNSTNAFSMTGGGGIRGGGGGTRITTIPGAVAADSTRSEDGRNPLGNSEEMGASALATTTNQGEGGGVRQRPETIPLSVWPLAIFKAFRKSYRTCNQDSDIRDEDTFRKEIRYDVVYHLLRNGPVFASGQTVRYKRKREYYPRGVKKQIKFTK